MPKIIDISDRGFIKNCIDPPGDSSLSKIRRIIPPIFMFKYDRENGDISIQDQGGSVLSVEDCKTIIDGLKNFCKLYKQDAVDVHNQKMKIMHEQELEDLKNRPVPKRSDQDGYVYILWSRHGYKVGKALNYKERTSNLITKLPFKCITFVVLKVKSYTVAEKESHNLVHIKRINGEWFDLTERDMNQIVNHLIRNFSGEIILDRRWERLGHEQKSGD